MHLSIKSACISKSTLELSALSVQFYVLYVNGILPVSILNSHGHAVVQLQSRNVAEPQHNARSVRPANTLGKPLKVCPGTVTWTKKKTLMFQHT